MKWGGEEENKEIPNPFFGIQLQKKDSGYYSIFFLICTPTGCSQNRTFIVGNVAQWRNHLYLVTTVTRPWPPSKSVDSHPDTIKSL